MTDREWVRAPRQARSQATLERFVEATRMLLEERSFEDITVADIVSKAERTVGSFYARFEDKYAVLHVLVDRLDERIRMLVRSFCDPARWEGATVADFVSQSVSLSVLAYRRSNAAVPRRAHRGGHGRAFPGAAHRDHAVLRRAAQVVPGSPGPTTLACLDVGRASDLMYETGHRRTRPRAALRPVHHHHAVVRRRAGGRADRAVPGGPRRPHAGARRGLKPDDESTSKQLTPVRRSRTPVIGSPALRPFSPARPVTGCPATDSSRQPYGSHSPAFAAALRRQLSLLGSCPAHGRAASPSWRHRRLRHDVRQPAAASSISPVQAPRRRGSDEPVPGHDRQRRSAAARRPPRVRPARPRPTRSTRPSAQWAAYAMQVARALFDALFLYDADGNVQPNLVDRTEHNADYTEWTVTLRPGVTVPQRQAPHRRRRSSGAGRSAATRRCIGSAYSPPPSTAPRSSTSSRTRSITKRPWPTMRQSGTPAGRRPIRTGSTSNDWAHPIGTGPFKVEKWDLGKNMVLTATRTTGTRTGRGNAALPRQDRVPIIPSDQDRAEAAPGGQLDIMMQTLTTPGIWPSAGPVPGRQAAVLLRREGRDPRGPRGAQHHRSRRSTTIDARRALALRRRPPRLRAADHGRRQRARRRHVRPVLAVVLAQRRTRTTTRSRRPGWCSG